MVSSWPSGPSGDNDYFDRGKYDKMQDIFQKNLGRDARPKEVERIGSKPGINAEKVEKITQRKAAKAAAVKPAASTGATTKFTVPKKSTPKAPAKPAPKKK
jgi:hypothetical protein